MPRKGARNGLQETPDRGEVRREAVLCCGLPAGAAHAVQQHESILPERCAALRNQFDF